MTDQEVKEIFLGMIKLWTEDKPGQVQKVYQELDMMDGYDMLSVFGGITAIASVIAKGLPLKENLRLKDLVGFMEA